MCQEDSLQLKTLCPDKFDKRRRWCRRIHNKTFFSIFIVHHITVGADHSDHKFFDSHFSLPRCPFNIQNSFYIAQFFYDKIQLFSALYNKSHFQCSGSFFAGSCIHKSDIDLFFCKYLCYIPVSYTHLDVYKRQVNSRSVFSVA